MNIGEVQARIKEAHEGKLTPLALFKELKESGDFEDNLFVIEENNWLLFNIVEGEDNVLGRILITKAEYDAMVDLGAVEC